MKLIRKLKNELGEKYKFERMIPAREVKKLIGQNIKAPPHKDCAGDAQSDFSSDFQK